MSNAIRALCLILVSVAPVPVGAAEPARNLNNSLSCPAELLVLQSDVRQYRETDNHNPRKIGLENRVRVGLSTLAVICRQYLDARQAGRTDHTANGPDFVVDIGHLTTDFTGNRIESFENRIKTLIERAPLPLQTFRIDQEGPDDEIQAGEIYRQYCHGCHLNTDPSSPNPAQDLADMARQLPENEFIARVWLGVKGTPEIGLSNPLTPLEISAMRRYLRALTK